MKHVWIFILVIAVAVLGWYFYPSISEGPGDGGELCAQVLTDARNPDTGEIQTFPTPCDVPEGWDTLETDHETFQKGDEEWSRYRNDDLGVRFEYRVEPDGYTLIEQNTSVVPKPESGGQLEEYVSLFNTKEYAEVLASSVPREGPPGISLMVFSNPTNLSPRAWAEANTTLSNLGLSTANPADITFAGSPAIRYPHDGLYMNEAIIASNNGRIYLITGAYGAEGDPIRKDFLELLETVALY